MDGNLAVTRPPIIATGYVSFASTFLYQVASTYYLQKKLISNSEGSDTCHGDRSTVQGDIRLCLHDRLSPRPETNQIFTLA